MVPRLSTTSCLDMPMPLSSTVTVFCVLLYSTLIFSSGSSSNRLSSCKPSKRSLSAASEALEMSSRRNISWLLYKEWIIRSSNCWTSV